mgnify:CR=1 FL=1
MDLGQQRKQLEEMLASLPPGDIVRGQQGNLGALNWYFIPLFPMFLVYLISGVAETNRAPFDMAEGESEIVAGDFVEYSSMSFALFFLGEYSAMILMSGMTVPDYVRAAQKFDANGYLAKPFKVQAVAEALATIRTPTSPRSL